TSRGDAVSTLFQQLPINDFFVVPALNKPAVLQPSHELIKCWAAFVFSSFGQLLAKMPAGLFLVEENSENQELQVGQVRFEHWNIPLSRKTVVATEVAGRKRHNVALHHSLLHGPGSASRGFDVWLPTTRQRAAWPRQSQSSGAPWMRSKKG